MAEYWVKASKSGEPEGPFSAEQVRDLARAGQLTPQSLVSPNGRKWHRATSVEGLFPVPTSIPMATAIDPSGVPVMTPAGFQTGPASNALSYASPERRVVHEEMRCYTDGQYPISPGKACGLCWVPIYNLYWMVYMPWVLAREINSYMVRDNQPVNAGGVTALGVLAFVPGAFIGGLSLIFRGLSMDMIQKGLNRLWQNHSEMPYAQAAISRPVFQAI